MDHYTLCDLDTAFLINGAAILGIMGQILLRTQFVDEPSILEQKDEHKQTCNRKDTNA